MKNARIIIALTFISLFLLVTVLTLDGSLTLLEDRIYSALSEYINPTLTCIMIVISFAGSTAGVVLIIIALSLPPATRRMFELQPVYTLASSALLNLLLKYIICRQRPDILPLVHETGFAFPSGHSMNNAALYCLIALILCRHLKNRNLRVLTAVFCALMTFTIGISRIYLGVHNAADVLAGWSLGTAIALFIDYVRTPNLGHIGKD